MAIAVNYEVFHWKPFFRKAQTPHVIDYFSLDIEGAEEFVMKGFPFDTYQFNVLTVERPSRYLKDLLKNNSYEYVKKHGGFGDEMWKHSSYQL